MPLCARDSQLPARGTNRHDPAGLLNVGLTRYALLTLIRHGVGGQRQMERTPPSSLAGSRAAARQQVLAQYAPARKVFLQPVEVERHER